MTAVWLASCGDEQGSLPCGRDLVVQSMSRPERSTPFMVVREPGAVPISAEERRQAATALAVMIH
jgi:hypothetical protein